MINFSVKVRHQVHWQKEGTRCGCMGWNGLSQIQLPMRELRQDLALTLARATLVQAVNFDFAEPWRTRRVV